MDEGKLWSTEWRRLRAAFAANLPTPCGICGLTIRVGEPFHLNHRVPRSKGGTNHPSNLEVTHPRCNQTEAPRLAWESKVRRRAEAEASAAREWRWSQPVVERAAEHVEPSRIF
jgi:5-methylcytosine-specific restriction endonuclease McrA